MALRSERGVSDSKYAEATASVTVVIVNWNGGEYLLKVLEGLRCQTVAPARIVVMDNGSGDGSAGEVARRFPEIRLRRLGANLGFAAANNLALREEVATPWVALLNPDAVPDPRWLEEFWRGVETHPGYSAYGCRMRRFGDPGRLDGTGDCYHPSGWAWRRDFGLPEARGHLAPGEIFAPCAAAALYRREDVLAVGGFDETFFCYFEDVDLGFRLQLAGRKCFYLPEAVVYHVGSASTGHRSDFSVYHGYRNLVWCYFKNTPGRLLWRHLPGHIGLNLGLLLNAWRRGQAKTVLRAQWDALRGLPGVLQKRRAVVRDPASTVTATMECWSGLYRAWRIRRPKCPETAPEVTWDG